VVKLILVMYVSGDMILACNAPSIDLICRKQGRPLLNKALVSLADPFQALSQCIRLEHPNLIYPFKS